MLREVSLVCGILSSLLYVAMNILGAMRWEGYSSISQTVSELSAIDAPSRSLFVPLGVTYQVLVTVFACGSLGVRRAKSRASHVGDLLFAYGIVGFAAPFFPMHLRGTVVTLTDTMHKVLTLVTVIFMMFAIGFGAVAFGKRFRLYSIGTILTLVVFGITAGLDAPRIEANLPTPWIGITERINIAVFLLWVVVLAIALLRVRATGKSDRPEESQRLRAFTLTRQVWMILSSSIISVGFGEL